jgi:hypothetical protein
VRMTDGHRKLLGVGMTLALAASAGGFVRVQECSDAVDARLGLGLPPRPRPPARAPLTAAPHSPSAPASVEAALFAELSPWPHADRLGADEGPVVIEVDRPALPRQWVTRAIPRARLTDRRHRSRARHRCR